MTEALKSEVKQPAPSGRLLPPVSTKKPNWRPLRFWVPETLRRLKMPHCILRQARRDEIANLLRQARKDGIELKRDCWVFGPFLTDLLKQAPRRKPNDKIHP